LPAIDRTAPPNFPALPETVEPSMLSEAGVEEPAGVVLRIPE
jgi:hypothetical protein